MTIEPDERNIPKYAECVYCYELYHRVRSVFGERYEYSINGELPKGTHEIIKANKSPNFLIHHPKSMKLNLAIIELKPFSAVRVFSNLYEDLCKLNFFTWKQGLYHHGIMHVCDIRIEKRKV